MDDFGCMTCAYLFVCVFAIPACSYQMSNEARILDVSSSLLSPSFEQRSEIHHPSRKPRLPLAMYSNKRFPSFQDREMISCGIYVVCSNIRVIWSFCPPRRSDFAAFLWNHSVMSHSGIVYVYRRLAWWRVTVLHDQRQANFWLNWAFCILGYTWLETDFKCSLCTPFRVVFTLLT